MMATAHALVGGAIAASTNNPALGISLSFVSHPILDMIPHWDFGWSWKKKTKIKLFIESFLDLMVGVGISYLIFGRNLNLWYFLACILASEAWDIAQTPYWFLNWRFFPFSTFYKFQHHIQGKAKLPWGILTQVATVAGFIIFLRLFR